MKKIVITSIAGVFAMAFASCSPAATAGSVEGVERQAPVTPNPNAIGDALNARNASQYSNGGSYGGRGYGGYGLGY